MNDNLKEIAQKYEVSEEQISEILTGMNVKKLDNPGKRQLEGLEQVCGLLKEGKSQDEAIAIVTDEAKSKVEESEEAFAVEDLDNFIIQQAERAAESTLHSLPQIAIEEQYRLKALFVQRYRERLAQQLQDPGFRQQFQAAIEGQELGKSNLLNATSNIALPSSSSSSSS